MEKDIGLGKSREVCRGGMLLVEEKGCERGLWERRTVCGSGERLMQEEVYWLKRKLDDRPGREGRLLEVVDPWRRRQAPGGEDRHDGKGGTFLEEGTSGCGTRSSVG